MFREEEEGGGRLREQRQVRLLGGTEPRPGRGPGCNHGNKQNPPLPPAARRVPVPPASTPNPPPPPRLALPESARVAFPHRRASRQPRPCLGQTRTTQQPFCCLRHGPYLQATVALSQAEQHLTVTNLLLLARATAFGAPCPSFEEDEGRMSGFQPFLSWSS
ncbi:unnamed protein product [Coccothraustes coccothraustes]